MVVAQDPERCSIQLNDIMINETETFTYLGTLIRQDGRSTKEIKCRKAQSKTAFNNLKNIQTNKKIPFKTRLRVLCWYVWPILRYACETWTLHCETKKLLQSVEMWYLRRKERISYTTHKNKEVMLSKTQKTRMLIKIIESRQLKFFGHVIRKEELEETIFSNHINGKRNEGRHRKYIDGISEKVRKSRTECIRAAKKRKSGNFYGKPMSETRYGTVRTKKNSSFITCVLR